MVLALQALVVAVLAAEVLVAAVLVALLSAGAVRDEVVLAVALVVLVHLQHPIAVTDRVVNKAGVALKNDVPEAATERNDAIHVPRLKHGVKVRHLPAIALDQVLLIVTKNLAGRATADLPRLASAMVLGFLMKAKHVVARAAADLAAVLGVVVSDLEDSAPEAASGEDSAVVVVSGLDPDVADPVVLEMVPVRAAMANEAPAEVVAVKAVSPVLNPTRNPINPKKRVTTNCRQAEVV